MFIKLFSILLIASFCMCTFCLSTQNDRDSLSIGEKVQKGIDLINTGKDLIGIFKPKKKERATSSSAPSSQQPAREELPLPGQPRPTFPKVGSNNPTVLGPNSSKTATLNGGNVSLSNKMADYTIKVTDCRGSLSEQSVTIYFSVKHSLADQYLGLRDSKCSAYADGMSYSKFATKVGGKKGNDYVPFAVEIKCEATIMHVSPSIELFDSISVDMYTKNKGSHSGIKTGNLELRNLKVAWQ